MAQLLDHREDQITITEEVVKAAARNRGNGDEVTTMLLDRGGDKLIITEKIVSIIARYFYSKVMALLFRRGDQIAITE